MPRLPQRRKHLGLLKYRLHRRILQVGRVAVLHEVNHMVGMGASVWLEAWRSLEPERMPTTIHMATPPVGR